jgi:4-amino-4-deoxy-L-arabinose transferase-like glycosyltransferase
LKNSNKEKEYVAILLLTALLLYTIWAIVIPFGMTPTESMAPDEWQRFDVVNFIFKYRELPITGDMRLQYGGYGITYASTPYFPYMISGGLCILFDTIGIGMEPYLVARLLSVISGVVTVYFCWLISNKIFRNKKVKYFFPIFVMFMPQFAFVCGYVNQDSFTIMLTAIVIYLWLLGIETNWKTKVVVATGITLGVVMLSYLNGYSIIVATLVVVLISYKNKMSKEFLYKFLICIGVMFLVCGWFFIRNAYINNGDFLGLSYSKVVAEELAIPSYRPSNRVSLNAKGVGFAEMLFSSDWMVTSFKSFWGLFGSMDRLMPAGFYFFFFILSLFAFGGAFAKAKDVILKGFNTYKNYFFYIGLLVSVIISIILHMYYSLYSDYQPQGRYMFPALIPILIIMCRGMDEAISEKWKGMVYKLLTVAIIGYNIIAVAGVLYVKYYIG